MVSAKDKGKEPMEEDLQDPGQEKEIRCEDEEEAKKGQHPHTGTTIASIGVLANPAKIKRTARMSTGGKPPHHCLSPRSLPPCTKNPFHTLIHEHQFQNMPKEKLPSNWDMPRSNHAGKEDFKEEEWGKNRKSWNSQPDMIMSRIEQNSELIRTLTFEIEDLGKLIKELIERIPPPPKE